VTSQDSSPEKNGTPEKDSVTEKDAATQPGGTTEGGSVAQKDSVTERPAVGAPEPWSFPDSQRSTLANGLNVVSYDIPGQYVISVCLAVPMPLEREPRDREGIATIMARTLDEGTALHTAEEFAELLERKGIALGAGASESGLVVDLDVSKRYLSEALDLLSQAVREPAFPPNEVSRHVKTRLAEIDQERAVPGQRAALEFITTYFDSGERASRPTGGTKATISAITPQDLVAFHAANVVPAGATVVVAGDLSDLDGSCSWTAPARCRPSSTSAAPGRTTRSRAAGRHTRCWASWSAALPTPGSMQSCARTRGTPTGSGRGSDLAGAGGCS